MSGRFSPVDEAARDRARREHGTSFVLEAGAGTGKTTLLVDRIESLVRTGTATLDEIAAVTFTENAATTMKLRLRERLERARGDASAPVLERARAEAALDVLERAPISTIHALCSAILSERPLECGVAPGFRVADDAEMDIAFAQAWQEWLTQNLVAGNEVLLSAVEAGIPLEGEGWGERSSLRGLARVLVEQRDLAPLRADAPLDPRAWREELVEQARRARVLVPEVQKGDTLAARLGELALFADAARFLDGGELESHLRRLPVIPRSFGLKMRWPSAEALAEGRRIAAWTSQAAATWSSACAASLHGRLVSALLGVVQRYEAIKRERGVLDFVDLLVRTRDALRDREAVRRYFHRRLRVLVIDEFQDTDPLQVEIADLLAGEHGGALVVVGDAKQSIYRFRRAEVSLFRRASERARQRPGHAVLHLTQNFRSRPAILRFVNRVFAELIIESAEAGQPAYEPITPPPALSEDASVIALNFEAPLAQGEDLLRAESQALARFVAQAARGAHEVRDPQSGVARPSRAGDVMVLARRLTQMRHLEEALEGAGLRFTVEGGKSFFDRQEVHEVLAVLRAIDDPSDRVSLLAALRSSFLGVSDRDIVTYALAGGPLWMGPVKADLPAAEALAPAMELLVSLHRLRTSLSVPALVEHLYDETRVLAALTGTARGEAQVANLEKVVVLARKGGELGALTLRGFTTLLQERIHTAREEPDLPSTRPGDPDTVRVLTIHKAKGLEAPIIALFDTADDARPRVDTVPLWDEGTIAIGFRGGCQPPGWDVLVRKEESKAGAELRRLLYVACTRARDLLVVPRPPRDARVGGFWKDLIDRLPVADDADVRHLDAATLPLPEVAPRETDLRALAGAAGGDAVAERWDHARKEAIASAAHRPFTPASATAVAARTAPPPVALAGRGGGRDFGSLVHRILEWIPLDRPGDAPAMAAALAPAFGLDPEEGRRAGEAARRALALPVMARARAARRTWREMPVWFAEGEALVEGIVDLVFEEEDGLVVVDYKTDHIEAAQAVAQAAHHAPQLQLYGRGLAQATGKGVRERLVLFTAIGEAVRV